ncbi:MAG: enoyl-CoA hydratase/isomerase family protein [Thermoplasmata archaeon]
MSVLKSSMTGKILVLTINRPEKKNSLTMEVVEEIDKALNENIGYRVILIKGEGGFFSAGADVSIFTNLSGNDAESFSRRGNEIMDRIQNSDAISIAAVNGGAYGGGLELALSCDIRVISPDTKIGLTEVNLGIFPGWGGMKRISQLVNKGYARYMALTGKVLAGKEAFERGIAQVLSENVEKDSMDLAQSLAEKSDESVKRIKRLLSQDVYSSELESKLFGEVIETKQARELVQKFLNRTK